MPFIWFKPLDALLEFKLYKVLEHTPNRFSFKKKSRELWGLIVFFSLLLVFGAIFGRKGPFARYGHDGWDKLLEVLHSDYLIILLAIALLFVLYINYDNILNLIQIRGFTFDKKTSTFYVKNKPVYKFSEIASIRIIRTGTTIDDDSVNIFALEIAGKDGSYIHIDRNLDESGIYELVLYLSKYVEKEIELDY